MKLSLSIFLLAAAALQVQAAANPIHAAAAKCISGSAGKGNGDGYKGFCCKNSDDCFESCVSGVCNGPTQPTKTSTSPAPTGTCAAGSSGKGKGDGYNGFCCKSSDDCVDTCVKGICNGPTKPGSSTTTTTTTTATTTTTGTFIFPIQQDDSTVRIPQEVSKLILQFESCEVQH